jgi:AAA+ superfamily predicted ATPase
MEGYINNDLQNLITIFIMGNNKYSMVLFIIIKFVYPYFMEYISQYYKKNAIVKISDEYGNDQSREGMLYKTVVKYITSKINNNVPMEIRLKQSIHEKITSNKSPDINGKLVQITGIDMPTKEIVKIDNITYKIYTKKKSLKGKGDGSELYIETKNIEDINLLIKKAMEASFTKIKKKNIVLHNDVNTWEKKSFLYKKTLSELFLSEENEKILLNSLEKFKLHKNVLVPHKIGYLLYGKPGTGKSATIIALSYELKRPIYQLNLVKCEKSVLSSINNHSIIAIEDIERQIISIPEEKREEKIKILMDFFDGYYTAQDVITIITSNTPESLDKILFRQGRVDYSLEYKYCDKYQYEKIKKYCKYDGEIEYENKAISKVIEEMTQ